MIKSTIIITIASLSVKDIKAAWALLFVVCLSFAGTMHLMLHNHLDAVRTVGDFAIIDTTGCIAYLVGAAIFSDTDQHK